MSLRSPAVDLAPAADSPASPRRPRPAARPSRARAQALRYIFAIFPLTPAFVGFAALRPPGLSLVPAPAALAVLLGALAAAVVLAWPSGPAGLGALVAASRPACDLRRGRAPLAAFLASSAIAGLAGFDPGTSALVVVALAISAIVHLAVLREAASLALRHALYATFLLSATLAATIGLVAWATGVPAGLLRVVNGRAVGTFVVPGEFAGYLVLAIAVAAGVAASSTGRLRVLAWLTLASGIPALAATYSRAGWYGCSVAMALIVVVERRRRWVTVATSLALVLEARLLLGFSDHHNPSEEFARLPIWTAALRAAELAPLTGTGPGAFRHVYASLRPPTELGFAFHPHSALLGTFTETGLIGAAAAAFLTVGFVRLFLRRLPHAAPARRPLALAIAAGLAGTAVQASVDEIQVLALGCWLPFVALALVETSPDVALRSRPAP